MKLIDRIDTNFEKAVNLIDGCKGRLIVIGIGKSGIIGKKIAATLTSIGLSSFFLHAAEGIHGDLGMVGSNDVVLAISNSGETDEVIRVLPIVKRFGVPLIGMTGNLNSTLSKISDITLDVSVEKEACPMGVVPTASTTVTLAMGDAIAMAILDKRNITEADFAKYHPGGSLGKSLLLKVEDVMHSGNDLPVVYENTSVPETIMEITGKKMGMTVVINEKKEILGIVTDGDLRRHFSDPGINNLNAIDIMTVNPKIISQDELAASAVKIMETNKITSLLIVTDDKRLKGVIHLHDLLQKGLF
ncbi:MAG: KpsF/GutQ family sugar-phosphate isomerase [Nitrospinae bacterium]|nr:KpsF/GutQ family sugar-phosphate isomerase [Nitrospinota bacterium]